jgi:hypothetical protein
MELTFNAKGFLNKVDPDLFNNSELLQLHDLIEKKRKQLYGRWINCQGATWMHGEANKCRAIVRRRIYTQAGGLTGLPCYAGAYIQAGTKAVADAGLN